jgi:23S rRNA-/tRNA-specific pseudouridylate synthase
LLDDDFEKLSKEIDKRPVSEKETGLRSPLNKKDIVFEDNFLLVVNKPAGINVHPGDHKTKETNLISQVQDYL